MMNSSRGEEEHDGLVTSNTKTKNPSVSHGGYNRKWISVALIAILVVIVAIVVPVTWWTAQRANDKDNNNNKNHQASAASSSQTGAAGGGGGGDAPALPPSTTHTTTTKTTLRPTIAPIVTPTTPPPPAAPTTNTTTRTSSAPVVSSTLAPAAAVVVSTPTATTNHVVNVVSGTAAGTAYLHCAAATTTGNQQQHHHIVLTHGASFTKEIWQKLRILDQLCSQPTVSVTALDLGFGTYGQLQAILDDLASLSSLSSNNNNNKLLPVILVTPSAGGSSMVDWMTNGNVSVLKDQYVKLWIPVAVGSLSTASDTQVQRLAPLPVLAIYGNGDQSGGRLSQRLAALVNATVVELVGGHPVYRDSPDEFVATILNYLRVSK